MGRWLACLLCLALAPACLAQRRLKALIVDGQNNHRWQETTPRLKAILEQTNLFLVDIATSPPRGSDLGGFRPAFSSHEVVVSNYNGDPWPAATQTDFEKYVAGGGGLVVYHAAANSFPQWREYNRMIGLGGWGGRDEKAGPYLRFRAGRPARDPSPGRGGHHGQRHPFQVIMRDRRHPIAAGLPEKWMHHADELYDSLRGPAENVTLLATAYSDPATGGTGEHEPILFTVAYGKGRVFHTTLGHDLEAMSGVGFASTLGRGAEWAASGRVTLRIPPDFSSPGDH